MRNLVCSDYEFDLIQLNFRSKHRQWFEVSPPRRRLPAPRPPPPVTFHSIHSVLVVVDLHQCADRSVVNYMPTQHIYTRVRTDLPENAICLRSRELNPGVVCVQRMYVVDMSSLYNGRPTSPSPAVFQRSLITHRLHKGFIDIFVIGFWDRVSVTSVPLKWLLFYLTTFK